MPDAARDRRARLVALLDRIPTLVWVAVAAAVLVGIVGAFGGLADAQAREETVPELAVGAWSSTRPYSVAVIDARRSDRYDAVFLEAEPGEELLIIEIDAVNTWDRQTSGLIGTVLLEVDGDGVEPDRILIAADDSSSSMLPPRVTTRLVLIWELPAGAVGGTAVLQLVDSVLRTNGPLIAEDYWYRTGVTQQVILPVVEAVLSDGDADEGSDDEDGAP